jgi:hypothetical protein
MAKQTDFDRFLRAVCVGYGYCGSLQDEEFVHVTDFIPERGTVTAGQFIDWLFIADGDQWLGKPSEMMTRERLRACFIAYMGSDVVQARRLRRSGHRTAMRHE